MTIKQKDYLNHLATDKSTRYNVLRVLRKCNPKLLEEIINDTNFLDSDATISERIYCILHDIHSPHLCSWCHEKPTGFLSFTKGYSPYCCLSCATKAQIERMGPNKPNIEKSKATRLAKYGGYSPSDFKEKVKQTKLINHGDENFSNTEKAKQTRITNSGSLKESYRQSIEKGNETKKELYGNEHYNNPKRISATKQSFSEDKNQAINEKRKETNQQRYGCDAPLQSSDILEKQKRTNLEKYGVDTVLRLPETHDKSNQVKRDAAYKNMSSKCTEYEPLFTYEEFMAGDNDTRFPWKHKICGETVYGRWADGKIFAHCRKCYPYGSSIAEKELLEFVKSEYSGEVIENDRQVIKPKEIDIYIPALNLAIEYDGLYYHSEEHGNEPEHLLKKTEACNDKGIRLIHIFEDEWLSAKDIVKSRIKSLLGCSQRLFAKMLDVIEVPMDEANSFLEANHIQGGCLSKVRLALKMGDETFAVMTFGKPRFNKNHDWELLRFCSKINYTIVGGASKLLKYFERKFNPKSIISYADRRWSDGNLYEKLGFTKISEGTPNYWYVDKSCSKRLSRLTFQKHNLEKLLESYDPNKTEAENMFDNGYSRIYDCGNLVFVKTY